MNIAIVGSRGFDDYNLLERFIDETCHKYNICPSVVVSGGARGADTLGELYATKHNLQKIIYPADWERYGRSAGFKRNVEIIKNCDLCFAFWDGVSHGTKHDIELCEQMDKKCYICKYKELTQNNGE